MRIITKVLIYFLAMVIYLNIGWVVSSFYNNPSMKVVERQTVLQKVANGSNFYHVVTLSRPLKNSDLIAIIVAWPVVFLFVFISWLAYGGYQAGLVIWNFFYHLSWLVFGGGIVKLLGWA